MVSPTRSPPSSSPLLAGRLLVVKASSALMVESDRNEVRHSWLRHFVEDIAAFRERGQDIVLVVSGAVALGRRVLDLPPGPLRLDQTQAAAACGQIRLAHAWQEALAQHGLGAAQVLLTLNDTEQRQSYLNLRATLRNLLKLGVIPIINENDAVATFSRRFTDNDQMASRVAAMIEADALVLLSDVEGLFTADPALDSSATFIPEVRSITPEIAAMAGGPRLATRRGGMASKIEAARIALQAGCAMAIARGTGMRPLLALQNGMRCTWFLPDCSPRTAWKVWIAGSLDPRGTLAIDDGATVALRQGKSLLAVGITSVTGDFTRGDPVRVRDAAGQEIARGFAACGAEDVRKVMGRCTSTFESVLGYAGLEEIIHRDDLALTAASEGKTHGR